MLIPQKGEVRKPSRSASGIVPVAVMLPPRKCEHGNCLYCPSLDVPQSYTPKSPVVLRAAQVDYDGYEQVKGRIKAFKIMNHPTDKVELIIMGGTFLEYDEKFQYEFVKSCYDGLNEKKSPRDDSGEPSQNLQEAKKLNEKAKHRCVALCIETRPDVCIEFIDRLRDFGCTRVELGVQMPSDAIYKKVNRGHSVKDVVEATKKLKDAGFKIGYHIMPGLPGSNVRKDLEMFGKLFSDEKFKPDQLKIYPCQVLEGAELVKLYWKKKYKPYTKEMLERLLIQMLKIVPRYCRVMRIMREIPPEYLVAGTTKIDLRKDVEEELRRQDAKIKEIRFREVGFAKGEIGKDLKLKITKYKASKGDEYFLEIVNEDDILFGLLRLRIFETKCPPTQPKSVMLSKQAIVRELHVYGKALKLGEKGKVYPQGGIPRVCEEPHILQGAQHTGLGKWLMAEAEKIVNSNKIKKLKVISGVGVREYYKKLGYELEDTYMVKEL